LLKNARLGCATQLSIVWLEAGLHFMRNAFPTVSRWATFGHPAIGGSTCAAKILYAFNIVGGKRERQTAPRAHGQVFSTKQKRRGPVDNRAKIPIL
jgi:hypothetical protein